MIKVYKDFLTDEEKTVITNFLEFDSAWQYTGFSNNESAEDKFWKQHLENNPFFSEYLFEKICLLTGENFHLHRVYMNGHNSGSGGLLHQDTANENGKTFLVYCNETWDPNHGGSTIFMTDNGPEYVYPQPFSAVYFNGNMYHAAQPLSKLYPGLRVTLAYKLEIKS